MSKALSPITGNWVIYRYFPAIPLIVLSGGGKKPVIIAMSQAGKAGSTIAEDSFGLALRVEVTYLIYLR